MLNINTTNYYTAKLEEMKTAADSLSKAAEDTPRSLSLQILNSLLKQCEMMNSTIYTANTWNSLMKKYALGKSISVNSEAKVKDLKRAVNELRIAISGLEVYEKDERENEKENKLGLPVTEEIYSLNSGQNADSQTQAASSSANNTYSGMDIIL